MLKSKKIITIGLFITLLIAINLITNYRYFSRLLYNDTEVVYTQDDFIINENTYEIINIDKQVSVIKFLFSSIPDNISIEFTNEYFASYRHFNPQYRSHDLKKDYLYVYCSLDGKIHNLRITSYNGTISKVIINPKEPYKINVFQTLFIYALILCLIYIFKKNNKLNQKDKKQLFKCLIVVLIMCLIAINYYYCNHDKGKYSFYNTTYTDSLINHKLSLDISVNKKNPNMSLYKEKYYCYYGLLPNLVLFVPYKLLTGNYMTNATACLIYTILGIISTFLLYKEIIKKYFKKIKFRTFILSFVYILFGSKLFWCMHSPNFYELIIIAAYFHVIMGLYLVLFNDKENKIREFLGCTFLASSVLCKPITFLASILIIPKLIFKFKKDKFKITSWLPVIIPYLLFITITMYINYIRFDNILEFGMSYQQNIIHQKSLLNGLIGSTYYLFNSYNLRIIPLSIVSVTGQTAMPTNIIIGNIGGGIITTSILGFIIFLIPYIIKFIKNKELKLYLILISCLAIYMIIISSSHGTLLGRNMLDFNYLIYFVSIIVSFYFIEKDNNIILSKIYSFVIILSIIINFMLSLSNIY